MEVSGALVIKGLIVGSVIGTIDRGIRLESYKILNTGIEFDFNLSVGDTVDENDFCGVIFSDEEGVYKYRFLEKNPLIV